MSNCQKCNSTRILNVYAKCSDCFGASIGEIDYDGYVPNDIGIGSGDSVSFNLCLDCGQLQGTFPLPQSKLEKIASTKDIEDFFDNHFSKGDTLFSGKNYTSELKEAEFISIKFYNFMYEFYYSNIGKQVPSKEVFLEMYNSEDWIIK